MFRTLYSKLALVLLVLFLVVGLSVIVVSISSTGKYQQEVNQKLNRELARLIVADKLILQDNRINREALDEIFHMLMVINPTIEIYLLDPEGHILAFSADPGKVKRSRVDLQPVQQWLGGTPSLPLFGDDPRSPEGKKVFSAARIPEDGPLKGYLYVILGGETYDSIARKIQGSYILRSSIWVITISIVVAFFSGLLLFAVLTRRLKHLTRGMDGYESGIPPERLDLPSLRSEQSPDEIDRLVSTFRQMAHRISRQMKKLEESDSLRRELVANISHDLRTPLATLQGYIETLLLKDERISREERRSYLEISVRHCERLSKLIAGLFELAKLDAQDTAVQPEAFSLGELVQDVAQKFHLRAAERNIDIVTNVGGELPFVYADIALIERVIENLLDNAIRYTPEKGTVTIELNRNDEKVAVHIRDTGQGMPEQEIPRIFGRFYQADTSRMGRSAHSGLGLAITKRILELHDEAIHVQSTLNKGTTFTFHLPVYRAD